MVLLRVFPLTAALLGLFLVQGCSDDGDPALDTGLHDATADVTAGDLGDDATEPDLGVDTGLADKGPTPDQEADKGTSDLGSPDISQDDLGADAGQDTAPVPDLQSDAGGSSPGTCGTAPLVPLVAGHATINGDTSPYTDQHPGLKCKGTYSTTSALDGPQAYYRIASKGGQWYRFTLEPTFTAYLYAFTSALCTEAAIQKDCQSLGATGASSRNSISKSSPKTMLFQAPASGGDVYVAVDSTSASGTFTLHIDEIPDPTNGTCRKAQKLVFFNGKALVNADTSPILTPDEHPKVNCGSGGNMDGPQAYFKFDAEAGKAYKIKLSAIASSYIYAYVFGDGCAESAISADCKSKGTHGLILGSVSGGSSKTIAFTPLSTGTYTIAVDGNDSYDFGHFDLEVEAFTPPTNGSCASPETITLTGGKVTVNGSTFGSSNEFGTAVDCTGSSDFDGPQVYYELDAKAGKYYKLAITPTFSSYVYVYPKSVGCTDTVALNAACGSAGSQGLSSSMSANSTKRQIFKPTNPGTYIIAIDSTDALRAGDFIMEVVEVDAPANDSCAGALPLPFVGSKAVVSASSKGAANAHGTAINCATTSSFSGSNVYYSFNAVAGKGYRLSYDPAFDSFLYIVSQASCGSATAINKDCRSRGASGAVLGQVSGSSSKTLLFEPDVPGPFVIVVDSKSSSLYGDFQLEVEELDPPTHQSCAAAKPITLSGGKASLTGMTAFGDDEFPGQVDCGKGSTLDGPQVYYTFQATAGQSYWIRLAPEFGNAYLYLFDGACSGAAIQTACTAGGSGGVVGPIKAGDSEAIYFQATTTGTITLAVDSDLTSANSEFGAFNLDIEEFSTASNATCTSARQLTFTNHEVEVSGFTVGTADEFPGQIKCGAADAKAAGQTYYKADLVAGNEYTITISADHAAEAYFFRGTASCQASAIESDCASAGATGGVVSFAANGSAQVTFVPTVSETYYLAIDGVTASDEGRHEITIEEFAIPTLVVPTTGLTLDFEADDGGLPSKGDWQWGHLAWAGGTCGTPPANNQGHVATQTGMWGVKLNDCHPNSNNAQPFSGCSTTDPSDDDVLAFNLDLSACSAASKVELKVWHYVDTSSKASYDRGLYLVKGVVDAASACSGSTNGWTEVTIDLSAHKGTLVDIRLHWMASAGANAAGWYIDELSVSCN